MKKYIEIQEFCTGHHLEESFIFQLQDLGVIRLKMAQNQAVIRRRELDKLERLVRLHRDLEINLQGLQAVQHLLEQLDEARLEIQELRQRLNGWKR
ncbi:MAG: hypothetical protein RLZZ241_777 [Bacteroidota bacterium]|jgi:hypothetical protein